MSRPKRMRLDDVDHPWHYRERFREACLLGVSALFRGGSRGRSGAGVGGYFDDAAHPALRFDTPHSEYLCHFAGCSAVIETRLGTESDHTFLD